MNIGISAEFGSHPNKEHGYPQLIILHLKSITTPIYTHVLACYIDLNSFVQTKDWRRIVTFYGSTVPANRLQTGIFSHNPQHILPT